MGGVLNALPAQDQVYRAFSKETGKVGFVRGQDPIFAAYRYLAQAPGVLGVWQVDRPYFNLPGYYYLHREIPFYDAFSGRVINKRYGDDQRHRSAILCRRMPISPIPFPAIQWRSNLAMSRSGAATRMMRQSANGRGTIRLLSAVWIRS